MRKGTAALGIQAIFYHKWVKLIGTFLLGQGTLQILQLMSGVLLFRWLTVEQYAQYSMAFAFQCSAQILVELGFSGTIVALVGDRIHDKKIIGSYIKAGQHYRNRLFLLISTCCVILFPLMTMKQGWTMTTTILLLVPILLNLYFAGWTGYYTPALKMHQKVGLLYSVQIKSSAIRLVAMFFLYLGSVLTSWMAAFLGSLQTFLMGYSFRKASAEFVEPAATADEQYKKEMLKLIKPLIPGMLFASFQSQIMVFISSIFGQSQEIAEIGALSRIGQMYFVFSMAGSILIAPYIARMNASRLLRSYILITGVAIAFCGLVVLIGYIFPEPILWLLGSKYDHLRNEIVLLLIASGINFVNLIVWEMNESRKWIYHWDPIMIIVGTILLQIACMMIFNLRNIREVLWLTILTNCLAFIVRMIVTVYGLRNNRSPQATT